MAEIPANWQRGCALAPFVPPPLFFLLERSVCHGDTLGLASMRRLFPQPHRPCRSRRRLRQGASTFQIAFVHQFREMQEKHLGAVYGETFFPSIPAEHIINDVGRCQPSGCV